MIEPNSTLSRRLLLDRSLVPVMSVVMAGVLLTTLVSYFYTRSTVERLAEVQITQALNFLDREINLQLRDMFMQVGVVSQEESLRLSLEDSYLGRSARVAAQRKLEGYVRSGVFERLYLINPQGELVLTSDPAITATLHVADRSYFLEALAGKTILETVPVSRVSGKPILAASMPLRGYNGAILGVIVGIAHTEAFAREMLNDSHVGKSGGAYIVNEEGTVIATPVWAVAGDFTPSGHAQVVFASAESGTIGRFMVDGAKRMCLARRNKESGWVLVLEADEDEVLAPATRLAALSGGISFITLALVAIALGALRRAMTSLRNSEADHRTLTELSPVGIATFDSEGHAQYMNKQARDILGLEPEAPLPGTLVLEDSEGALLIGELSPIGRVLKDQTPIIGLLCWLTFPEGARKALYLNATLLAAEDQAAHGVVATLEDITERMEALKLLHESEERFSSLFRLSPDSIVLSDLATGIIVDVNETFSESHGLPREDALGKTVEELGLYVNDSERIELLERVRSDGHIQMEAKGRNRYGEEIILSLSSQVMEIGEARYRMTVARDVTERYRAEQELRENRRLLETILNTVPLSIFWKDKNCVFLGCNNAFAQTLGLADPQGVIGKTDYDFPMSMEESNAYRADDLAVMRSLNPKLHFTEPLTLDNGRTIWIETSKLPLLDDAGQAVGLLGMFEDITERLQAERELRDNRRLLETILNTVPMAIFWLDRTSTFLGCNLTFAQSIGLESPQALIGMTELTLPVPQERREIHKADNDEVFRTLKPKLRFIETQPMPNGNTNLLEVSKLPLLDEEGNAVGLLGMFEDITERLRSVEKLKLSEERFSRLFRLSPEAIILVDAETTKISDANEAFSRLTGHALEDIIGHDTLEMGLYADPATRERLYRTQAQQEHVENAEFEGRRKDGQIFICSTSGQAMEIGDRKYLLILMRDVTEMKKMQEMMIQTEKMISVGGIAAGIAHEINNPLGIVLQAAQNLVQRTRTDFQKNLTVAAKIGLDMNLMQTYMQERKLDVFIEDIQSAAVRASAIIRHMLDFSRSSESRRKTCDLPAIIDKAIALAGSDYDLKKSYDFKRIKIVRDYADDLPSINCTETEIEQVVLNLLRNAAQALAACDPPVETPRIEVVMRLTDETVRIEVGDNGPGMPPEVQRRVFEPFFTTKPPGVGTGLGLSVSYFIITKGHGGKMSVASKPGAGTRFTIELPRDDRGEA